jgi:sensor histidine kinase regulating citrate/malate metabolism
LRVRVSLACDSLMEFKVCDSGRAVPANLAGSLFRAPVRSDSGLGIGLFQAARQAEANGYAMFLATNRDGEVCFALTGPASPPSQV